MRIFDGRQLIYSGSPNKTCYVACVYHLKSVFNIGPCFQMHQSFSNQWCLCVLLFNCLSDKKVPLIGPLLGAKTWLLIYLVNWHNLLLFLSVLCYITKEWVRLRYGLWPQTCLVNSYIILKNKVHWVNWAKCQNSPKLFHDNRSFHSYPRLQTACRYVTGNN